MRNFNKAPSHSSRHQRVIPVAILATLALAISGCGSSSEQANSSKPQAIKTTNEGQPHVEGQPESSMTFYPDGTAVSGVNFTPYSEVDSITVSTHYSCPNQGPNLQIISNKSDFRSGGSAQLIPDSLICDDGRVTQSDFESPQAEPTR